MKKLKAQTGGTRHHDAEAQGEVPPYLPPLIDPTEIFNCPSPVNTPGADARLFGGDLHAALRHKWRDYLDEEGRVWVTNIDGDPDTASPNMLAACEGLHVGEPRPTTYIEGTLEKLKAAGIVGLYRPKITV